MDQIVPAVVLAAVGASFSIELNVMTLLNKTRNEILDIPDKHQQWDADKQAERMKMQLWNDWVPLAAGNLFFLITFTLIVGFLPGYLTGESADLNAVVMKGVTAAVILGIIGLVGFAYGGWSDFQYITKEILGCREKSEPIAG